MREVHICPMLMRTVVFEDGKCTMECTEEDCPLVHQLSNSYKGKKFHMTLVILAAGIGSRFGTGIKQLTPVDDFGHLIIDYSIHDAVAAGFDRLLFIIRHDIESDFKTGIGNRIEAVCESLGVSVAYAYQEKDKGVPMELAAGRAKPWGTGHAVLCCDGLLDGPFAVINADDYYGKNGFIRAAEFLGEHPESYALVGYQLRNTLSEHGGVTRGICSVVDGKLTGIAETRNIVKTPTGAAAGDVTVDTEALVSMNFWCYPRSFMDVLRAGFPQFLSATPHPDKDEYLLPIIADAMLKDGVEFTVLPTDDRWFGVTYQEDRPGVEESFRRLIEAGVYRPDLYSDLR